ncbi:MAG TPA: APC family permease [Patescibacteria group bacterium]|nr:APC family permease [Patescibacteria group bacterium]
MVATTAMLSFISFWRAAAIVLNDMGSSAFYAGAIAEQAIGKSAPWFVLAIMCLAYAVAAMYIESCSMFVRGGVYRVVKEAMGSTLAKFSVSALMFDYVLTGPISGVSAGLYLVGLLNELLYYSHRSLVLPTNLSAAIFAILVTLYFWWENIKGITESSDKALRIMQFATVMVVAMLAWAAYTLYVRGAHLPPLPSLANLRYSHDALGWLRHSSLPYTIGAIGILIGLGHSVLAMSGEETLAQVYREIEHPKLKNLKKTALIIFIYSLVFTAGVAFLAVMIIPDNVRPHYFDNLISGLAMNFVGPYPLRLAFQVLVVVVGVLMLAGAVNTAIVGSNGVLNRVSEDGILSDWFRQPHPRFGTSYRILNLVAGVQILTIILSRGNLFVLGEAYAFGVMWSFAMKGLAVVVLRFTRPGERGFRVPFNFHIGKLEIPFGLILVTATLFALCTINLFTKQVATISGVAFTAFLFIAFTYSEKTCRKRGEVHADLDQFNLAEREELTLEAVGARSGNFLVPVSNYYHLQQLGEVLDRVNPATRDVVVLHVRPLLRGGSGEHDLAPDQLFTTIEQHLFTKALEVSEKKGKTIHLAMVAANDVYDAMLRQARNLQSSAIVLGSSGRVPLAEQGRTLGDAWERLPDPKPQLRLEIYKPNGQEEIIYLGPHAPRLTPKEVDLLHKIWLRLSGDVAPAELHHHDIVHFALDELNRELDAEGPEGVLGRLRKHMEDVRSQRDRSRGGEEPN